MIINISKNASELGLRAAQFASIKLNEAIRRNGEARNIMRIFTFILIIIQHLK